MDQRRIKIFLGTSAVIALLSLVSLGVLLHLVYKKESALGVLETELMQVRAEENSAASMQHLLVDTREERQKLDSYFIAEDDVVSFIESVEGLADTVGVAISVNSVGVEETTDAERFEYVRVNAAAEGSFKNLYWLLSLIEHMPMKLEVRQVYLEERPAEDGKGSAGWKLTFTIRALKIK